VKRPILVSGIVLITLLGVAGGYLTGDRTEVPVPTATGEAAPLGEATPSQPALVRKTPEPNDVAALRPDELDFRTQRFTVQQDPQPSVQLSVRVPEGWQKTVDKEAPGEVKFLDPLRERGARIEAGFQPGLSPTEMRDKLILGLESSQPYENDLKILDKSDDTIYGTDGQPRQTSTLIYTFIPKATLRWVLVRWVATAGDDEATVEMSITGLPQDAKALIEVADQAAKSATPQD
jgi:hypothetical protein